MAVKKKVDMTKKPATVKPQLKHMYISVKVPMYHPFAKVMIPTAPPGVQLDPEDSWVKSQKHLIKCL